MAYIKKILLFGFLAPLATYTMAADDSEDVIVTGIYTPVQPTNLSSSVSILTQEFLLSTNKRSVADALRTVPGLLIEEAGGPGGLTSVSIRGGEANFTLVLLDGVAVNDPTNSRGGSFDFNNLDMASVERIEIVRGPQSAVYGSDALAGVINIITRRPTAEHRQRVTAEWGEDDYHHYGLGATGTAGNIGYSLQLAQRDSGEPTPGSSRDNDEANIRLEWGLSEAQQLEFNYHYLDGKRQDFPEQSGGPEFAVSRELDRNNYTDEAFSVSWRGRILPNWHSELSASRFEVDEDYRSPGIFPFFDVPPQASTTEFSRDQLRWVNAVKLFDRVNIALGADYRDETGDSTGKLDFDFAALPTDFSLDRSTTGFFLDGNTRILPSLLIQGSVRYDDPDDFDSETTLKLGGEYQIVRQLSVLANWGEGFKLPSFSALGNALVGNPELLPETGESWEVGLKITPYEKLAINAVYFSNEYEDLVDFDSELFIFVNRTQVETSGAETQINWMPADTLNVLGHATYTDIDVKGEAAPLLGRPDWKAGATVVWQVSSDWRAALDYQWTGEQYSSSRHTGDTVIETLDNYHQLDMNVAWQVLEWVSVQLSVDNALDEDFYTAVGFPGAGRSVRLGFTLSNL